MGIFSSANNVIERERERCQNISSFVYSFHVCIWYVYLYSWIDFRIFLFCYNFIKCQKVFMCNL